MSAALARARRNGRPSSPWWIRAGRCGLGSLDGVTQTITAVHELPASDFNPVAGGGLTGLGSPIGEKVISDLVGGGITSIGSPPGVAAQLVFNQQPTNVLAGIAISPPITVDVEDSQGNVVGSDNSSVTLSFANGPGDLAGTLTVSAVGGMATFSDITLDTPGSFRLAATDGALASATSTSFTVAAPQLVFIQQPTNALIGKTISPPIMVAIEYQGNVVTSENSTLTLAISSGPSGASVGGRLSVSAMSGVATFSDISLNLPGNYTLSATDGILASAVSAGFSVAAPHLVFSSQPVNIFAGIPISPPITVAVEDSSGHVITSDGSTITLGILTGPAGTSLGGTVSVAAVRGVANFSNITANTPGNYRLTAGDGPFTGATSTGFTVAIPGWIDAASMNVISGWGYDPTNPAAPDKIEVDITGGPTQTFSANGSL